MIELKEGMIKNLKEFIISWNNKFINDRSYRKKNNISFGSEEHLKSNQIDIFLDALEDHFIEHYVNDFNSKKEDLEDYRQTGNFLKERESIDEDFENFKLKLG